MIRCRLTTSGTAAHNATPGLGDNALMKLGTHLVALGKRKPAIEAPATVAPLIEYVGGGDATAIRLALELEQEAPQLAGLIEPLITVTAEPTMTYGSDAINVIPSRATLSIDCRLPPGTPEERALLHLRRALAPGPYELEVIQRVVGNSSPSSPIDSPLVAAIHEWIAAEDAAAIPLPVCVAAFSDAGLFREAFPGCQAYGFFPHRHMTWPDTAPLLHAADERIDARDIGFAARFYAETVRSLLGNGPV